MKRLLITLIAIFSILISCTKKEEAHRLYSCRCTFTWLGRDTTMLFNYPGVSMDSAAKSCGNKDKWVLSLVGPGAGGCRLN